MTLTKEQQAAIAEKINSMTLPSGLGDRHNACSISAINLALSGRLTDKIPDCMSLVIGKWIIAVQDAMPDAMRNSATWKSLLPLAAGTGREFEHDRMAIIVDWMWDTVLPYVQPIADSGGYGEQWRTMYSVRTLKAALVAADAADAADAAANAVAGSAADAAAEAAAKAAWRPVWATVHVAWHAACSAVLSAKASGDQEKAWRHFDPCGLLQKLVEVGNDIA
jgi:hypothetical protein